MRAVEHSGTNKGGKALPFLGLKKQRWVGSIIGAQ